MQSRKTINPEILIEQVKKRPLLYDYKLSGNTVDARKPQWEEVCKEIFSGTWETSNKYEKEALVKEVQVKWKSLRDSYMRMRKQEREDALKGVKHRKKYIFSDQLSFLAKCLTKKHSVNTSVFLESNESSVNNIVFVNADDSNPLEDEPEYYNPDPSEADVKIQTGLEETQINGNNGRFTELLQEIVGMQKEDKSDDRMGNKKFLLSLLPFMEKLPDDVNLEVRLQLMSVIQAYSSGKSIIRM